MTLQKTGQVACHVQIREIALEAASELYERLMGDNSYYDEWKRQNPGVDARGLRLRFVNKNWPRCIQFARASLSILLQKDYVSEAMKDEIMDVLEKDQALRRTLPSQVSSTSVLQNRMI